LLAAVLLAASTTAQAAFLTTDPTPAEIQPGDALAVALQTGPDFGTWTGVNIDLTYNADVLSYDTTAFNTLIGDLAAPQMEPAGASGITTITNITGSALTLSGTDQGGSGAGTLATMVFQAVAPGVTDVAVTGTGGPLIVPGSFNEELSVGATVVPLPAPILLFLSGLAGIAGFVRFGRRAGTANATTT
jgi:hypothetical protein